MCVPFFAFHVRLKSTFLCLFIESVGGRERERERERQRERPVDPFPNESSFEIKE
jgi:hypothetical protein